MTIGLVKGSSLVAIVEEISEGILVEPTVGTEFIQVLEDGLELSPAKETVERTILTSSIGMVSPRVSVKSVSGAVPVEWRGSGVEGDAPQYDVMMRSALGSVRTVSAQITTDTGHSTTTLEADAHGLVKGDFFIILEAGSHHAAFVQSVTVDQITFVPEASFTPTDNVVLSKSTTYFPANSGHPSFTTHVFWGDEIQESAIGCKISGLSLENFTTGQIANLNFAIEGLSFDEKDGSAPVAPIYQPGLPPLVLSAVVYQDGVCIDVNEFSMSLEDAISFLTSVKSADGRLSSRVSSRTISGSFAPYKDDTSVANFTRFNDNELFEMVITVQNPSAVTGEFELGSCMGIYLPQVLLTERTVADNEGILTEALSFSANRGEEGTEEEIYMSFV